MAGGRARVKGLRAIIFPNLAGSCSKIKRLVGGGGGRSTLLSWFPSLTNQLFQGP